MCTLHVNLFLIRLSAAELPLRTNQESIRIAIDEQLRNWASAKPPSVGVNDLCHVFRLTFGGQVSGPAQHWLTRRTGVSEVAKERLPRYFLCAILGEAHSEARHLHPISLAIPDCLVSDSGRFSFNSLGLCMSRVLPIDLERGRGLRLV